MGIDIAEEVEWITESGKGTCGIPPTYKEVQESQQFFCTFFLHLSATFLDMSLA